MLRAWRADFRCCATDVDGTLTLEDPDTPERERGCIHPAAYEQIRRMSARGIPVVLVTGRPLPTVEGLALYLGLCDRGRTERGAALIAENGAVVKWNGAVHRLARAPRRAARAAVRELLEGKPFRGRCEPAFDNALRVCDVGLHTPPDLLPRVRAWFEKRPELGLQAMTSNIMSHVVCAGVSKARALHWALERMNLGARNVVVFGDSDTDVPLFEEFERSVAVANYFTPGRAPAHAALPAVAAAQPGGAGFAAVAARLV